MKKVNIVGAAALALALVVAPAAAYADELVDPTVSEEVVQAPAETEVVPAVQEPVVEETVVTPEVAPPAEEAPAAPVVETVAPETLTKTVYEPTPVWVEWVVPVGIEPAPLDKVTVPGGASVGENGFAQWALGHENAPTCDAWVQGDWYPSQKIADGFLADGKLEHGEDHGYSSNWTFRYLGDCEEPPVVINECEAGVGSHSTNLNHLWTEGDTRATGKHQYDENGYRVWTTGATSTDKVQEWYDIADIPMHDTGVVSIDFDQTVGNVKPGVQLKYTFAPGLVGTLVAEPNYADGSVLYGQDFWLTNGSPQALKDNAPSHEGGNGSENHGTIDQWLTKYPEAVLTDIGYSAGSGVYLDGYLRSITVGCGTHTFGYEAEPEVPTFEPSCTTVNDAQTINGDGVLSVAGGWAEASINVPFTGTLADIGTVLDVTATNTQYLGLHIDTDEGTIVFEEEPSYEGKLWSTSAWAGVNAGLGYAALGTISEYIHLNGDVEVTGIRLVYTNPEASTTTVESFTIGCTVYTFEPEIVVPPTEEPPVVTPNPEPSQTVTPPASNDNGTLAFTGAPTMAPFLWFVGIVLTFGIAFLVIHYIRQRRADKAAQQ